VTLPPWEYLFQPFNDVLFPDLFNATWVFSIVGIVATVALYNIRTRQLRRHQVYLDLYEWLLWAGVIFFFMLLVYAVFHFDFLFVAVSIPVGVGILLWIRFIRFPPSLAADETQLARSRYFSMQKFAHPEADDSAEARGARRAIVPPPPLRLRRHLWRSAVRVGNRRPDGPAHTTGVSGQVIHSDGRGTISELAFARRARIEPHTNPNSTWFVVIEGGGWAQVGGERAQVAAGEAVLWPADVVHAAWTELSEMRAIVVELAGADDALVRGILDGRALALGSGEAPTPDEPGNVKAAVAGRRRAQAGRRRGLARRPGGRAALTSRGPAPSLAGGRSRSRAPVTDLGAGPRHRSEPPGRSASPAEHGAKLAEDRRGGPPDDPALTRYAP